MIRRFFPWKGWLLALWAVTAGGGSAFGAGFALMEQSVRRLGTAYAGGAAAADDASTVFYNPAGLTRLPGTQAAAGLHLILPSARFSNEGSTHLTGEPLSGGGGGDAGRSAAVPSVYLSRRLSDRVHLGLGVSSPFGLSTRYDSAWAGRYHAVKSELVSVNINPAVAVRVTEKLSLGAGVSAQQVDAELTSAVDFGAIFAALGVPGMAPQGNDGLVTFEGDSWSWGYNVGALYQFTEKTRGGIAYRSSIDHSLRGDADFSGVPSPNPTGRFADTGIKADATLPEHVSASLWHSFTPELAAMADVTWTRWSRFEELRIRFDNPAESDAVTTESWEDSFRYSLGAVYTPGAWTLRAGAAYDESPVPDAAHRTPRIPDSDRTWVAVGVGYAISEALSAELGYAHLFVQDSQIRKTATGEDRLRGALSGSYESDVDIVGAEVQWRF